MKDLPKIELHMHLEGAAPPSFIRGLASEKNVDLSGIFDENGGYKFADFWDFLRVYEAATSVLQSPDDFARLTRAVLEASAENGVIYTESFLSPDFCGGRDVGAWREYLHAIREAANSVSDIEMRGIVTCIRHFGPDKARETALCAAETMGPFITGFGMGGDEKIGQQGDFAYAFDMAREAGLRLTTHAGEWGGPQSVRAAIRDLRVERIGHGVRAIEDLGLVDEIAEAGIVLECCPGSNVALGLYDWRTHPLPELRKRGCKVTISTDDPPFFHTDMTREFERMADVTDWDEAEFIALGRAAVDAAFCDDATKDKLLKKLDA